MFKVAITFGVNKDKDNNNITTQDAITTAQFALKEMSALYGGATLIDGMGGYIMSGTNDLVTEQSNTIYSLVQTEQRAEQAKQIALKIKEMLNQECVIFEITPTAYNFI